MSACSIGYDAVVLGGGAAGLFAAITAGRRGRRVLLLEHGSRVGRKILVSGGGRCNFTNLGAGPGNYLGNQPAFARSALARFRPEDFVELVRQHRIPFHEKKLGQLFCTRSSRDLLEMLEAEARDARVTTLAETEIREVTHGENFRVRTSRGEFLAPALVVATGGLSWARLGATDLAYRLARQFGLRVVATRPGLVGLQFSPAWQKVFAPLSGLSFPIVACCGAAKFAEQALLTHHGMSGPAILQISSYADGSVPVRLDLVPELGVPVEDLAATVAWLREDLRTSLARRLHAFWPERMVETWLEKFGPPRPLGQCRREDFELLARNLRWWEPDFHGTDGYIKAEVTIGGVDTRDLSSKTMEARNLPGLFFIGEAVDITGWLGGYNFQWAWASGHACGLALADQAVTAQRELRLLHNTHNYRKYA